MFVCLCVVTDLQNNFRFLIFLLNYIAVSDIFIYMCIEHNTHTHLLNKNKMRIFFESFDVQEVDGMCKVVDGYNIESFYIGSYG